MRWQGKRGSFPTWTGWVAEVHVCQLHLPALRAGSPVAVAATRVPFCRAAAAAAKQRPPTLGCLLSLRCW